MVHPKMIQSVISALKKNKIVNIYTILKSQKDIVDKNRVKVTLDKAFNATYFSRAPILNNLNRNNKYLKQGNLFGFKYEGLKKFCELKRTKLEEFESIDMLRLIENDIKIKMIKVNHETINIDTLDDFKKAVKTFKNDKLKKNYL